MEFDLSDNDLLFAEAVKVEVRGWLRPVPFFVLSPSSIHDMNKKHIDQVLKKMLEDKIFVDKMAKSNIIMPKLEFIMRGASEYEIWKRGWMMRGQWFLQVIALIVIWNIAWTILT